MERFGSMKINHSGPRETMSSAAGKVTIAESLEIIMKQNLILSTASVAIFINFYRIHPYPVLSSCGHGGDEIIHSQTKGSNGLIIEQN